MDAPSWLNDKLLEESLREYYSGDYIEILESSCKLAIGTGENYTTFVYRINVTFLRRNGSKNANKENMSLIVKCMREGIMTTLADDMYLFPKEINMFRHILPEMEKAYGSEVISSKCLNASLQPHPFIIVQDLCSLGFQVHERQRGLDLAHTLKILEKMAIFHGTSYVVCKKNPKLLEDMYNWGIFFELDSIKHWINVGFDMLTELATNCKDFEKYREKFEELTQNDVVDRCSATWHRKRGEFSVMTHGDSWINNMMFSYDEDRKPKDCRYIDFQLSVYASPTIDLHYFLSTSLANDIIQDIDHFIDYYYIHLLMTLHKMKESLKDVPSLKEFKEDFRKRAFYGLTTIATVTALVKADGRDDANFENFLSIGGEGSFRHHCYNNDNFKGALIRLLPIYEEMGVFS